MNCTGMENNIWDCPYDNSYQYCSKYQDAAVICQCIYWIIALLVIMPSFISLDTNNTVDTSCNNRDICLVGGINELEGRVEICYNKMWGSVCHTSWSTYDANVVCKQLGYQPTGRCLCTVDKAAVT